LLEGRVVLGGTGTTGHGERRGERNGVKHSLAMGLHEQSSRLLVFSNQVVLPWRKSVSSLLERRSSAILCRFDLVN
jgi:hypothetical protein